MSKIKSLEIKNEKLQKQFKALQDLVVNLFSHVNNQNSLIFEKWGFYYVFYLFGGQFELF